jgi:hypothetical protein
MTNGIKRALDYPYARPKHSFLLSKTQQVPLSNTKHLVGLIPVIACGSNAAPEQLRRKYTHLSNYKIPVTAATLDDFLCGYSPHFSGYGAIPATFIHWPNAKINCHITWLTEEQLAHMNKTEAVGINYRISYLTGLNLNCGLSGHHTEILAYVGMRGYLSHAGQPIAISDLTPTDIPNIHRWDQRTVQNHVASLLSPDSSLEDFTLQNINDADVKKDRIQAMQQYANVPTIPGEIIKRNTPL